MVCDFALFEWEAPFLGCAAVENADAAFAVHKDMAAEAVVDCFAAAHGAGEEWVRWWKWASSWNEGECDQLFLRSEFQDVTRVRVWCSFGAS